MMQPQFIFGGDTGVTDPVELKRRRDIVDALIANSLNRAPQTFGEGLTAIGNAIAGRIRDKRLGEQEAKAREEAQGQFSAITGALVGPQQQSYTAPEPDQAPASTPAPAPGPNQGLADDVMRALGKEPVRPVNNYRDAIASIESAGSGDYAAIGPTNAKLGRPLGRYQIMEANLPQWSQEVLGRQVSADEFMASPQLQDAIFDAKFGQYVQQFGPEGAAQAWLGGPGAVGKTSRADVNGTTVGQYGAQFMRNLGGGGGGQPDIAVLAQLADNPYLGDSQRAVIKQIIAQRMQPQEPPKPVAVGGNLVDPATGRVIYQAPQEAPKPVAVGGRLVDPSSGEVIYEPPQAGVPDEYAKRMEAALAFGLKPGDPAYQSFVLTGKMPREDQAPLTVTDKKAIIEADDVVASNTSTIDMLKSIITPRENGMSLNEMAGSGALAGAQSWAARNDPTGLFSDEKGQATTELKNVILTQALAQLKATFGGNPTEGERAILVDIQASVDKTPAEREIIIRRAIELANKRLEFNRRRAEELRGGTYYKPQEQQQPQQSAPVATHRFNPQTGTIEAIQ